VSNFVFVKVLPNKLDDYLVTMKRTWLPACEASKSEGIVSECHVFLSETPHNQDFNVILMQVSPSAKVRDPDEARYRRLQQKFRSNLPLAKRDDLVQNMSEIRTFFGSQDFRKIDYAVDAKELPSASGLPEGKIPTDIRRITILVRDIDASLKLYRDVLGLKVNYDEAITVGGVALPAGVPGNKTRLVLLNGNDPWIGWIGLMQYTDPPLPDPGPYPTRLQRGGHVIVTNTDDVVRRCAMAKALPGVRMTIEPRVTTYPGRNGGPPVKVMGCNFFDPDGTFLELNHVMQ
jgi:catechol 2,3-dioxygenase-like lactoylglutathione lyase family enzyme